MATLIILPIHIYIIYSWHCWNYINGFGSRPMEHVYPLLALGLASFYTFVVLQKNKLIRYGILTLAYFLIFLNLFQVYQSNIGVLRSEFCTRAQYMALLFQTKFSHRIMIGRASNEWQPSKSTFLKTIKIFDFEEQGYWH